MWGLGATQYWRERLRKSSWPVRSQTLPRSWQPAAMTRVASRSSIRYLLLIQSRLILAPGLAAVKLPGRWGLPKWWQPEPANRKA